MHEHFRNTPSNSPRSSAKAQDLDCSIAHNLPSAMHRSAWRDERRTQWKNASDYVSQHYGPVYPPETGSVLLGIHALGFTPVRLVKSDSSLFKIPTIEAGESAPPLCARFEEQRAVLMRLIPKISVPAGVRWTYRRELGFSPLSLGAIEKIGAARIEARYPEFFAIVKRTFEESLQLTQDKKTLTPTSEESARIRRNIVLVERLGRYVKEFGESRYSRTGMPLRLTQMSGEPAQLAIGNSCESDPYMKEAQRFASREFLFAERRFLLARFGEFLRERFFVERSS